MPFTEAGMRMEPAPSLPYANGTMPEATAQDEPPEDPATPLPRSHGLLQVPFSTGSVATLAPNSGRFALAITITPAAL
jgi:hypothetical protein